jgi:hypothetical protein
MMARRYGGKFSPDPPRSTGDGRPELAHAYDGRSPVRGRSRLKFLFFLPIPMAMTAFTSGDPRHLALGLGGTALLLLAAWLTREGVAAQAAYDARQLARRPAIPRKIFASVLTGLGVGAGALATQPGLVYPLVFGVAAAALHSFAFGLDPLRDKGMEGVDAFQTERVARAVDEAEAYLGAMKDAILRANDRQLAARVDRFAATARALFRNVEANPGDLTAARKFLSVYLMGARDATVKFADHYARARDPAVRADYEALLDDLETHFAERTQALLTDNRTDLDVEIGVLRDRLARET